MEKVALVQMPWGVADRATLSLGLLKRILEKGNIPARVYYLNLRFAARMKPQLYEVISGGLYHLGDWMFGQALFSRLPVERQMDTLIGGLAAKGRTYGPLIDRLKAMRSELEAIMGAIPDYLEECLDTIPWEDIRIAGFSCKVGSQLSSLLLARKIKERFPHVKTVFGGPNVFGPMGEETIRSFRWVDYVVDGECESTVVRLFENILSGDDCESIPGIWMRRGDAVLWGGPASLTEDLDSLPIPDYSEYFDELKRCGLQDQLRRIVIPYESTRGCWWGEKVTCSFCGVNNGRPQYRTKSADRVLNEITFLSERYSVKNFYAADCIMNMAYFDRLIPELAARGLNLDIYHDIKPCLTKEQLSLLRKMGVSTVLAGIESLDDELLTLMRKGTTALQNIQLLKFCRETDIHVLWSLLYGIPGEDPACYENIMEIIPLICHLEPPGGIVRICLDRFSPYHDDPEKYEIREIKPAVLYEYMYPEQNVNLNNLAYTFEFDYENSDDIKRYIKPLSQRVMQWSRVFRQNPPVCEYLFKGDSIEITDTRPGIRTDNVARKAIYHGAAGAVFAFCDEIRSFTEIRDYLEEHYPGIYNADDLKSELDHWVHRKLMLQSDGKFLSLAVAANTRGKAGH